MRLLAAVFALVVAAPASALAQTPTDDLVYAYAGKGFLIDSHARRLLLEDHAVLARFAGAGFAPACVAFMRTIRAHRDRYDREFKPLLVAAVRNLVPGAVLASSAGQPAMPVGGPLLPYRSRIQARLDATAAPLYARAVGDYRSTFDATLAKLGTIAPQGDDYARYSSDGTSSAMAMRCGVWAGEHQALVFPQLPAGDR